MLEKNREYRPMYFMQSHLNNLSSVLVSVNNEGLLIESNQEFMMSILKKNMKLIEFIETYSLSYEYARIEAYVQDQLSLKESFWMDISLNLNKDYELYRFVATPIKHEGRFEGYLIECMPLVIQDLKLTKYQTMNSISGLNDRSFGERMAATLYKRSIQRGQPLTLVGLEIQDFNSVADDFGRETEEYLLHFVGQNIRKLLRNKDIPYDAERGRFYILCESSLEDIKPMIERIQQFFASAYLKEIDKCLSFKVAIVSSNEVESCTQLLHLVELRLKI